MRSTKPVLTAGLAAVLFAGCSQSGSNPVAPKTVANLSSNVLQMNVGTANLFGTYVGTNVAVTYRQPAGSTNPGASAVLVSSPTLTIPHAIAGPAGTADKFNATIATGPATAEIGGTSLTATSQTPNAMTVTSFGNDGGAFGLGIEPFNYVAPIGQAGVTGTPANVTPYAVPLFDTLGGPVQTGGTNPNAFIPGGGPPAFNIAGNTAATLAGFNAISEGLDVFHIAPAVGTYALSVLVPANSGSVTQTASAALSTVVPLPVFVTPVATVATSGAATLTYALPAGVTEAYLQVTDFGPTASGGVSCVGASFGAPVYYTIEVTSSGTATLPANSICGAAANTAKSTGASDGDAFTVQAIGFDYPAYEASYPNSLGVSAPSVAGTAASHQADLTISAQTVYNIPAATAVVTPGGLPAAPAAKLIRVNPNL